MGTCPMKTFRLPSLRPHVLLATLAFASFVGAAQAAYTVNLTTPWKVGQGYNANVTTSETTHTVFAMGAQKLQDQTQRRSAKLDADAKVLELYPHGGLRKAEFTVRSLLASTDGAPETPFLPAGTKIVAESKADEEKTYTINGATASAEQKAILALVISLDDEKHNDQILFGPKKPVTINESWLLDGNALKASLGKDLGDISATQGSMRLDAIEGSGDNQIAVVSGSVIFTGIKPAFPLGITPKAGVFKAVLDGRIPATRTASKRVENLNATANLSGEVTAPTGVATFTVTLELKNASVLTFP